MRMPMAITTIWKKSAIIVPPRLKPFSLIWPGNDIKIKEDHIKFIDDMAIICEIGSFEKEKKKREPEEVLR